MSPAQHGARRGGPPGARDGRSARPGLVTVPEAFCDGVRHSEGQLSAPLSPACTDHGHEDGLPERGLRNHVLAVALRIVVDELRANGHRDVERSLEILHVAIEDALTLASEEPLN